MKCHNYSGCLLAYRGEEIEVEEGSALICPECGKPLKFAPRSAAISKKMIMIGVGAVVALLLLVIVGRSLFSEKESPTPESATEMVSSATPEPSTPAPPRVTQRLEEPPLPPVAVIPSTPPMPLETKPSETTAPPKNTEPTPQEPAVAEPAAVITSPAKIDLNPKTTENQKVKAEVLARIDVMPNISQNNKDKLYASVERARSMGKVLTIPFASGRTTLTATDITALKTQVDSPALLKIRDDPTAVFVVLGYADPKGDKQQNLDVSQARADAVLAAMRDKCGVVNVMHSVAMGASTLIDAQNLDKNRTVEVWAILP